MKLRTLARAGVAAVATAALTLAATPAQAYEARDVREIALICDGYIDIENIQIPGFVNCTLDYTGEYLAYLGDWANMTLDRVGNCIYFYDPLFSFPNRVAPETIELANCIA